MCTFVLKRRFNCLQAVFSKCLFYNLTVVSALKQYVIPKVHKCSVCVAYVISEEFSFISKLTNDNRHLYFRCKKAVCMLKANGAIEDLLIGSLNDISDAT